MRVLVYERQPRPTPFLKIYRDEDSIIFETHEGIKEFKNFEDLKKDFYFAKLYEIHVH